jgi:hypothetical protein
MMIRNNILIKIEIKIKIKYIRYNTIIYFY